MSKNDDLDDLDELFEEEDEVVIIEDEFGNEQEFFIIDTVEHKGAIYLLVTPSDEEGEDFEATILKYTGESDEDAIYTLIDDDSEFNEVAALFMENEGDYEIEV